VQGRGRGRFKAGGTRHQRVVVIRGKHGKKPVQEMRGEEVNDGPKWGRQKKGKNFKNRRLQRRTEKGVDRRRNNAEVNVVKRTLRSK